MSNNKNSNISLEDTLDYSIIEAQGLSKDAEVLIIQLSLTRAKMKHISGLNLDIPDGLYEIEEHYATKIKQLLKL